MSGFIDIHCCDCGRLVGRTAHTGPLPSISCEECSDGAGQEDADHDPMD